MNFKVCLIGLSALTLLSACGKSIKYHDRNFATGQLNADRTQQKSMTAGIQDLSTLAPLDALKAKYSKAVLTCALWSYEAEVSDEDLSIDDGTKAKDQFSIDLLKDFKEGQKLDLKSNLNHQPYIAHVTMGSLKVPAEENFQNDDQQTIVNYKFAPVVTLKVSDNSTENLEDVLPIHAGLEVTAEQQTSTTDNDIKKDFNRIDCTIQATIREEYNAKYGPF